MMTRILLVMLGGSLGALSRYGVALLAARLLGAAFPWGTLIVNLAGCFLIGLFFSLADRVNILGPSVRLFFVTGFLGALTTFSTYALETVNTAHPGTGMTSIMNFLTNNVGGISLVILGMWLGRLR